MNKERRSIVDLYFLLLCSNNFLQRKRNPSTWKKMGKPTTKKKGLVTPKYSEANARSFGRSNTSKAFDEDTAIFINMSQELKEEGNKLFQKRDTEGAMLKYEKALKLLPRNHIDVAYLRSNMAACYMQMGLGEYPRAINECNLALEVAPKYSKALLKRAKCYGALNRQDLALRDVSYVLSMEPNNLTALELADELKMTLQEKGLEVQETVHLPPEEPSPPSSSVSNRSTRDRGKKKKSSKFERKKVEEVKKVEEERGEEPEVDKKTEDKAVVEEELSVREETVVTKSVKLILGEDIRWAQLPVNCNVRMVRSVVLDRFSGLQGVLIKYKDQEGDLVTITTTDELRMAEAEGGSRGFLRLYISEVSPDKEPFYEESNEEELESISTGQPSSTLENGSVDKIMEHGKEQTCVEDWIVQFARVFRNHVGFDCDSYLDIHEVGMKLYSEAMDEAIASQDAQELFEIAASKFQEMGALAMFNWGNVHMSRARKEVSIKEDSKEPELALIKSAYEWAKKEYVKAGMRYEEALKIKPDFYEALLALGLQQFEHAKLVWYYSIGSNNELNSDACAQVLELYNKAEDSMDRGVQMWEEMEEQRLNGLSKSEKDKAELKKLGLDGLLKDLSPEEAAEQVSKMKSHIHLLWGKLLYERSVVEYKLSLPSWEECLEVAVEKFELAGASPTDIAVMVKNHCSNETALEDFEVDEIVQAWNEMYDANRWLAGVSTFRLESLFRRRAPKLHSLLQSL